MDLAVKRKLATEDAKDLGADAFGTCRARISANQGDHRLERYGQERAQMEASEERQVDLVHIGTVAAAANELARRIDDDALGIQGNVLGVVEDELSAHFNVVQVDRRG